MTRTLALVCMLVGLVACRKSAAPEAEEEHPVHGHCEPFERGALADTLTLYGTLQLAPEHSQHVSAQTAGRITSLRVHEGDTVKQGDILAEIEPVDTQEQTRTSQQELAAAQQALATAQARVTRLAPLVSQGIAAQQELDDARAAVALARGRVASLQGSVTRSRVAMQRTHVQSPAAGLVLHVLRTQGEVVDGTSATPIVVLANTQHVEFVASVTAVDLEGLRLGLQGRLAFEQGSDALPVTLSLMPTQISLTSHLADVRFALNAATTRPMGTPARVEVTLSTRNNTLRVPVAFVHTRHETKAELFVCHDSKIATREVTLGASNETHIEITEGIEDGDSLLTDPVVGVEDGAEIETESAP